MRIVEVPEFRPRRSVATCGVDTPVSEAAGLMAGRNVGAIPVVDGDRLVGIFSERDLVKRVVAAGRDPAHTPMREVMTPDPQTGSPDDPVRGAIDAMIQGGFRHLPITDGERKLIGILSLRDFVTANWRQMFARARRNSVLAVTRAQETYILVAGVAAYTLLIGAVATLAF